MPKNDIGGFFVSLGLNADKNSFETGNKLVDGVANSFNKLIGTARNAAVVLAGTAVASGVVESSAYKTAEKIGISTEKLDLWKASAKIAGIDANGLVSAMGKLSDVVGRMRIDGAGLEQFTKKLGELGLIVDDVDIAKMLDMAPDELMTDILRKAQEASAKARKDIAEANKVLVKKPKDEAANKKLNDAQKENQRISIIVGDILGEAGQDFFIELERQGKSIDQFKAGAGRTVFTNAADNQKGANFAVEVNTLKTELESMGKLVGDSIGGELTPYLRDINKWIQDNGPAIADNIRDLAKVVGKIAEKMKAGVEWVDERVKTAGEVDARQKSASSINEKLKGYGDKIFGTGKADYKKLPDELKNNIATYYSRYKNITDLQIKNADLEDIKNRSTIITEKRKKEEAEQKKKNNTNYSPAPTEFDWWNYTEKVNDGIMRPDGTVTQVAPDDWVFAVRDLGNLAEAFTPEQEEPKLQNIVAEESKAPRLTEKPIEQKNERPIINEQKVEERVYEAPLTGKQPAEEVKLNRPLTDIRQPKDEEFYRPLFRTQQPENDIVIGYVLKALGNLNRIPAAQNNAPHVSAGEYTINQTFNISGSNDIPQVLKQQAYRGTQDGLLELMQQSSQRLQLMSGIR